MSSTMRSVATLSLLTLTAVGATTLSGLRPQRALRLRGGAEEEPAPPPPGPAALTREEITNKLNGVPTFCIMNEDGGVVSMRDPNGSEDAVCSWYTDANEAKAVLAAAMKNNPTVTGLHLGVHGLGNAFSICKGWADGKDDSGLGEVKYTGKGEGGRSVSLRLQGNHGVVKQVGAQLQDIMKQEGIEPGDWLMPVFVCEELQSSKIFPVFFHPEDVAKTWLKAGRSKETTPENLKMMDLRSFVAMLQKPDNPWHLVQFISSQESIELATEEAQKAMRAAGGLANQDDGDVATFEEEDEDEEEL